jgi:prephenate dehydrogenase
MNATTRTTAILGFGRFGRALSDLLLDAGYLVRAFDPSVAVPEPLRAGSLAELVRGVGEIVLAVPVDAIREATRALRPHLDLDHLVVDVASVKHGPVRDLALTLGREIPWVATHPLFGPTSIALGERPLVAVVCPNPLHPAAALRARGFFASIGCEVVEEDAVGHDRAMAATHALAFFVAKGLIDVRAGEGAAFVPPSFRAMEGMIGAVRSDASHLFATIQNDNPFAAEARARLLSALQTIDRDLAISSGNPSLDPQRLAIPPLLEGAPDLREARDLIEDIDRDLVHLLGRRAHFARRAGRARANPGKAVVDSDRERQILEARRRWAESEGLDPDGVVRVFESIMGLSRALQSDPE